MPDMDNAEKKRLANEKRLKAVREWHKNRNSSGIQFHNGLENATTIPKNKIVKYVDDDYDDVEEEGIQKSQKKQIENENQLKLFESDNDDNDEDYEKCFKIRPQFEGKNGLRMLEMSSELSERFKLDERFKEDEEPVEENDAEDNEKSKYFKVLETVLGHEVSKKHPVDVIKKRKREIERFDPEDEADKSYVKDVESIPKKPKKKKRKTVEPATNEMQIPHSSERYVEVSSNLKDIMSSTSTFSFAEKFNFTSDVNKDEDADDKMLTYSENQDEKYTESKSDNTVNKISCGDFSSSANFHDSFFISDTDERMKEGIEFFVRPKPQEVIQQEWDMKKKLVLDIFRMRKRAALRSTGRRHNRGRPQRRQIPRKK